MTTTPAPLEWAQRKDTILITVRVIDAVGASITSDSTSFTYTGKSSSGDKVYNQRLELFAEIDETQTKFVNRPRGTEIVLKKKDDSVWWPRLAKTTTKLHYVSVDWNRWIDSSSDDEGKEGFNWDPSMMEGYDGDDDLSDDDDVPADDNAPETAEEAPAKTEE